MVLYKGWKAPLIVLLCVLSVSCFVQRIPAGEGRGGMLAFEDHENGRGRNPKIVVSNPDGTQRRVLAEFGFFPKWFPSGDRLLFFIAATDPPLFMGRYTDVNGDIRPPGKSVIVDLSGRIEQEIPYRVTDISPNGSQLLVVKYDPNVDVNGGPGENLDGQEIAVYDLQTKGVRKVIGVDDLPKDWEVHGVINGKWLPDGERIIFQLVAPDSLGWASLSALCLVRTDGTGIKTLTERPTPHARSTQWWNPRDFAISKDGKQIVFVADGLSPTGEVLPLSRQLHVMNVDGTHSRPLTQGGDWDWKHSPVWSPDGKKILYTYDRSGEINPYVEQALMVINVDGGRPRRVFPETWRHYIKALLFMPLLLEWDTNADWWAPSTAPQS